MPWALLSVLTADLSAVQAADGDIVLFREVQPRTATRQPLVPDPNPRVVNPQTMTEGPVKQGTQTTNIVTRSMGNELSDSDFADVSSGSGLAIQRSTAGQAVGSTLLSTPNAQQGMPTSSASHQGGGANNAIAGQVNRSIQQGMRPLQMLGGQ
ncbi:hypothetical protein JQX08_14885 [Pseudomonas sp. UL073]|uniref:Fap n=1 Tax=Zestomonas insulae TaxID=2809017 RepID=A0ABS2IGY0_9GAMM|nr:hypothetical protein [Pseudomonas insulae]